MNVKTFWLWIGIIAAGQIAFALYAPTYTRERFTGELFATIGIKYDGTDLHKLNEGAHYFGQTLIGWTKFPSFHKEAVSFTGLPQESQLTAHMQERQNIVFQVASDGPITSAMMERVRYFMSAKMAAYGQMGNVKIDLANVDYQIIHSKRDYWSGALIALIISLVIAAGGYGLYFNKSCFFTAISKNT